MPSERGEMCSFLALVNESHPSMKYLKQTREAWGIRVVREVDG